MPRKFSYTAWVVLGSTWKPRLLFAKLSLSVLALDSGKEQPESRSTIARCIIWLCPEPTPLKKKRFLHSLLELILPSQLQSLGLPSIEHLFYTLDLQGHHLVLCLQILQVLQD